MRIMLDMDDCAYPLAETAAEILSEQRGVPLSTFTTPESWDFPTQPGWDMTLEEWREWLVDAMMHYDLLLRGEPKADFEWAVEELAYAGHELEIVTARNYKPGYGALAYGATVHWLDRYNLLPFIEGIHLIDRHTPKSRVCYERGLDIAVDDGIHNYEDLMNHGILCMLMDSPMNQSLDAENRISGWIEFVQTVQGM